MEPNDRLKTLNVLQIYSKSTFRFSQQQCIKYEVEIGGRSGNFFIKVNLYSHTTNVNLFNKDVSICT